MHHIVSDGLSTAILERELGILYEAALSGAKLDAVLARAREIAGLISR